MQPFVPKFDGRLATFNPGTGRDNTEQIATDSNGTKFFLSGERAFVQRDCSSVRARSMQFNRIAGLQEFDENRKFRERKIVSIVSKLMGERWL